MPRRTVRKPTRWTAEEWARVTDAARPLGISALASSVRSCWKGSAGDGTHAPRGACSAQTSHAA
jgi:hypothetical protein